MPKIRGAAVRRLCAILVIVGCALLFMVRLVDVQVVSAPAHNAEAEGRRAVPVVIPSLRGEIVDRNGKVFATTDERYDVQLSPKNTRLNDGVFYIYDDDGLATVPVTAQEAFEQIGAITGQSGAEIQGIVDDALEENPRSDFAYVKRSVDLSALNQLKALQIPWLTFESNHARTYPNGAVGGNLVGFAGTDSVPQAGVELSQDACLTGIDGVESFERGADGVALPGSVVVTQEAVDGGTVQLTIDRDLQWESQQIINSQIMRSGAEWGFLTIMDARTGELVAVAEDGSVDPNNVDAVDASRREARSFTWPYEPGSTLKTATAAALLDQGLATPMTQQLTPDSWNPEGNVQFSDWFNHAAEQWTLTGIMVQSSNVGISMLGSQMSEQTRYDYLRKFGLGESTNAGMQFEDSGMLYAVEDWDRQTSYNTMFGQGLSSTVVQTAGIYQTIANNGVRVPPSVVKGCVDENGELHEIDHGDSVEVISERAAADMRNILETVAAEGLVVDAVSIPGYRIGGKTGTAEFPDGAGGYRSDYVYSFAGMFPMEDPQYVVVATVAFPKDNSGSIHAVQAFRAAAEATIRTFHIPPSTGEYLSLPQSY